MSTFTNQSNPPSSFAWTKSVNWFLCFKLLHYSLLTARSLLTKKITVILLKTDYVQNPLIASHLKVNVNMLTTNGLRDLTVKEGPNICPSFCSLTSSTILTSAILPLGQLDSLLLFEEDISITSQCFHFLFFLRNGHTVVHSGCTI